MHCALTLPLEAMGPSAILTIMGALFRRPLTWLVLRLVVMHFVLMSLILFALVRVTRATWATIVS